MRKALKNTGYTRRIARKVEIPAIMVYNMVMLLVNIHDAKTHLSEYLNRLETEQEIVLCKRNVPVAVIRPVAKPAGRRVIGLEKGRLQVPDSFNDPLPEEMEALYSGEQQ